MDIKAAVAMLLPANDGRTTECVTTVVQADSVGD